MRILLLLLIGFSLNAQIIQTNWSVEHPMNCAYPLYSTGQQCLVNSHAIVIAQLINYHGHPEYPFLNNCYDVNASPGNIYQLRMKNVGATATVTIFRIMWFGQVTHY